MFTQHKELDMKFEDVDDFDGVYPDGDDDAIDPDQELNIGEILDLEDAEYYDDDDDWFYDEDDPYFYPTGDDEDLEYPDVDPFDFED